MKKIIIYFLIIVGMILLFKFFDSKKQTYSNEDTSSYSVRCSGTTKRGNKCKNMTYNLNGRCDKHK